MEDVLSQLATIRANSGAQQTTGLKDEVITRFAASDENLIRAISEASKNHKDYFAQLGSELLMMEESKLVQTLQSDFINFYSPATVNPYVAIAARGPWIITSHGAVLHDNGGYGMLGVGHGPDDVICAMSKNWVMANVMTASFSQKRLADALRKEVGHSRGGCPYSKFICVNSGSESVTLGMRIADVNSNNMTGPGGRHEGKPIKIIALKQAFHGRTQRPASISDSCKKGYIDNLATFRERDNIIIVEPNNVEDLQSAFSRAEQENFFIELLAIEPVQGEGSPGQSITREFYDEARRLTLEHGSMLLVDSIQAGFRGKGSLSIVDYPGFQSAEVPDLETWSKALNAGQFPLSVLGLSERAAKLYVVGIYGNTMTTNPRALETAVAVLSKITPELRANIIEKGDEFLTKLGELQKEFPNEITLVQGSGLLLCAELDPEILPVVGFGCVEEWCRLNGLGVIHGGKNALRFTPHFGITSEEIDLVINIVRDCLMAFSRN
jgi:acetylornithine/succinyldiaminopimelate/putrescine aminotransferase